MKVQVLVVLLTFSFVLSGCYDKSELEQQAYVIAIGVDKGETENSYKFTFQIANPEVGSSITGGSSQEPAYEIITIDGNDFLTATSTANSSVSKKITLDHTKVLIVSEELARSEDFIRVMQGAARTTQIRRQVNMIVSKENARDFIRNTKSLLETRPHKYYQLMLKRAIDTGVVPTSTIHRFFQITEGDADLFLAMYATTEREDTKSNGSEDEYIAGQIPEEGGNPTQFMGSAVLKEGKMIDVLNGEETRLSIILDNTLDMNDLLAAFPDPEKEGYKIAGDLSKKENTKVDIDYKKNGPTKINVTVPFELEISAIPSLVNYSQNKELRKKLKKSIEESLKKNAEKLVKKAQEEYKSDPFYWSLHIRKHFKTVKEYEEADWHKKIWPNADVNITFDMTRLEFGKALNDSKLSEVRD